MPFPFRNPVNYEDSPENWSPPDYAKPIESGEAWKPPDYASPVKEEDKTPKKSLFSKISEGASRFATDIGKSVDVTKREASKFLEEHPKVKSAAQQFLTGTSPELEEANKKAGIKQTQGQELMKVPGAEKLSNYIREKGRNTGNYAGGFIGSVLGDIVDFASTGFDPRTAGPKEAIPESSAVRQSREIPYRVEESPKEISKEPVKTSEVRQPPKFVNPFEKPIEATPEIAKIDEKPLPVRSPNLDANRFSIGSEEPPKQPLKSTEQLQYELAQEKFNMGRSPDWQPPEYAKSVESKPTAEFAYDWPEAGGKQYDIKGGPYDRSTVGEDKLRELGIDIPESPESSPNEPRLSGDEMRRRAVAERLLKTPEVKQLENEWSQGFGGAGHPESPDYVDKVLKFVDEKGEPGLSVEKHPTLDNIQHVAYRGSNGEPIAVARIVEDTNGKKMVSDLATDKSKGFASGRAVKAITDKLQELGATETSNTLSSDAENLVSGLKKRGEWKPPRYAKEIKRNQPNIIEHPLINPETGKAGTPESLHPQLTALRNYGDDVLHLEFNKDKPMTEDSVKALLADKGYKDANVTEMYSNDKMPSRFRVDVKNADNLEKSVGGSFDETSEMHGGLGGIGGGSNKPEPFKGPAGPALDKLFSALDESKGLTDAQQSINKTERARRFSEFSNVKEEGFAGAAKSLGKLKGNFEKIPQLYGKIQLEPEETDSLFTTIKRANITPGEKARGYTALFKILNGESLPVRSELKILDDVFGNGFGDRLTEMHGGIGAVGLKLSKLANTMKSLQNSISLAAPLRHGIGLAARKEFYPAFGDMFKFFGNKEYYNTAMRAIEERPNYMLGRESGLFIAKPNSLMNSEEEFLNSYVGKIPLVRDVVGASQRAYTGFLNKLRSDTFDSMIEQAKGLGHDVETKIGDQTTPTKTTKSIANYINTATGRGDLGSLNKMTNELNLLLWSPRMIASRVQMFNPSLYTSLPKGMRLDGLKSLLGIAALGTTIDTLAAYAGAKVSTNILSTDYGKSRFGTHVIDPWGGFQQYIVGAARFLAGKTDSSSYPPTSRLDIAGRFLANKESPAANLAHTILTARQGTKNQPMFSPGGGFTTEYGQKTSVPREIAQRFTPIFVQDLEDLAQSEPKWSENVGLSAILGAASLAGMSQDYPAKQTGKLSLGKFRKLK